MDPNRIAARIAVIYPWEDPDTLDLAETATEAKVKLNQIFEQLSQFRVLELKETTKYARPDIKEELETAFSGIISAVNKMNQVLQSCGGK